ncbi:MAG TPA: Mur ligase family protein [Candidatus Paceibacterota bacterium]
MKKIVTSIIAWEARIAVLKNKPKIIGITGSVGKSSTKEFISCLLSKNFKIRQSPKSYNSKLGFALSVLGLPTYFNNNIFGWFKNIVKGFLEIWNKKFPDILVLEMGIDHPKDMDDLIKIAFPDIAVVTAIGEIPVHVEFFSGPEAVAQEKAKILKYLSSNGYAILNFDDDVVWSMKEKTKGKVISFGFGDSQIGGADFSASNLKISLSGSTFKMDFEGSSVPVHLKNALGKQNVYPALAAAAVGKILGLNLIEISEYLSLCELLSGRMKLIEGIKNTKIIDDSYNSSPLAAHAALDTISELEANLPDGKVGRKIAVLGDMLEIGKYTIEAHKAMGQKAVKAVNVLITVGLRAKFAFDEALALGMNKANLHHFSTSKEAASFVKDLIEEGDLVLVKGSQGMRMERVVEEILAHPEDASKLLVRQEDYWKKKE